MILSAAELGITLVVLVYMRLAPVRQKQKSEKMFQQQTWRKMNKKVGLIFVDLKHEILIVMKTCVTVFFNLCHFVIYFRFFQTTFVHNKF